MDTRNLRKRLLRPAVVLVAFTLTAAACGSSDDDADSTDVEAAESAADVGAADTASGAAEPDEADDASTAGGLTQEDVERASAASDDDSDDDDAPDFDRSTIEGIFEEAAWRRARAVEELTAKIDSGEYGIDDDNVLHGPAGFAIDLDDCPADWSDTGGVTDTEIRLGQTGPQTGALAAYGNARLGWQTYLKYMNETGGVAGRDVVMKSYDDAYVSAQTIEFVDELIESDNVFSIHTLGSPNTLAVYDKLNNECIPQVFVWTGHPAWGDPVNHPWTTGSIMSYSTEAVLWGNWIKENLADQLPVVVAGLVMDNDFGLAYELGFAAYAENNPDVVSAFFPQRHDPAAPTVTNQITTLAASDPDVFISMTAGNACLLAIQDVTASGLNETISAAFTPSVCKAVASFIGPAGSDGDGWWVVGGGLKDTTDPGYIDEPFIRFIRESLAENDLDPGISLTGAGYNFAYPYGEALRVAAELPGGLTRTNFMLAVRAIDIYHPLYFDGMSFSMNGNADSYPVEGSDFSQFDAGEQTWRIIGEIVDVNGASANCAWDKDEGGCS